MKLKIMVFRKNLFNKYLKNATQYLKFYLNKHSTQREDKLKFNIVTNDLCVNFVIINSLNY